MRVLAFAACAAVLFASDEASAACGKGLLWPYVRNPGDCLTDEEIRTGKIGDYSGPVNTAPDVSAIKVEQPPAQNNATASAPASGNAQGSSGRGLFDQIGITGLFGGGGSGGTTAAAGTAATSGETNTFSCNKGYLWPFYRTAGDCLTDIEKKQGHKGVYGGGSGIAPATISASTVTAAPPNGLVPAASGDSNISTAGAAANETTGTADCRKGLFWPFVRDSGDCLTDAEKKKGQSGAYGASAIAPAAVTASKVTTVPASARPPAEPATSNRPATAAGDPANGAAGVAGCRKGLLWPFVREPGDCRTDSEKRYGPKDASSGPAVTPAAASASPMTSLPVSAQVPEESGGGNTPATGAADPQSNNTVAAGCRKGLLWPFVREPGDCRTDSEKARSR